MFIYMSNDISSNINNVSCKDIQSGSENKTTKKTNVDNCQELININYKTMLMNGNDIRPKYDNQHNNNNNKNVEAFLENELNANKKEIWIKINKTQKIAKLNVFVEEIAKDKFELTDEEINKLKIYLIKALDRKNLLKSKEVIYNKETGAIENIPYLFFQPESRGFILKKDEKHVSTVKSLPPDKRNKIKTLKIHE